MIRKYRYGTPFNTEALTEKIETTEGVLPYGEVSQEEGFVFTYIMDEDDIVYGLGEAKLERYGDELLNVLSQVMQAMDASPQTMADF